MHLNLSYGPDPRHKLDLYLNRKKHPSQGLILFLYGGTWKEGDRQTYRFLARSFTGRGFDVAIPDYRLYPGVRFPAFMEDAALALHWLHQTSAKYGLDPSRLFVMGHSAGAHIGALLCTNSRFLDMYGLDLSHISAFVGLAGPYTFNPLNYDSTSPVFKTAAPLSDARPIKHMSSAIPPMLLLHGEKDTRVYPCNTINMTDAVNEAGGSATKILYPGLAHKSLVLSLFPILCWRAPVLRDIAKYLNHVA